mmetsp:Transcript_921/g.3399  ORF Transcript_921/g.3399 Transcript_921/m.3399 type:complete len:84 (-) Transcript_921:251-502(-)
MFEVVGLYYSKVRTIRRKRFAHSHDGKKFWTDIIAMLHTCFEQLDEFLRESYEVNEDRLFRFESLELFLGNFEVVEKERVCFT